MTFPDSATGPGDPASPAPEPPPAPVDPAGEALEPTEEAPRPRLRVPWRGLLALGAIGAAGALAVMVAALVLAAVSPEYGFRPNDDARGWAARPLGFAPPVECARCHPAASGATSFRGHAGLSCQGCHGPGSEHAIADEPELVDLALSTSTDCVRCHSRSVGRPDTVPQVQVSRHYTAACLDCHDPHTAMAIRPPKVPHPLIYLPACIVCHGPDGFVARDQRHPLEPTDDEACLECHNIGRGQIAVPRSNR